MGRSVANESFLRALLHRDPFAAYHFYLSDRRQGEILRERLHCEFPQLVASGRIVTGLFRDLPDALARYDFQCFHLSDCLLHNPHLMWLRNRYSRRIFPITGSTHSLSYARYMPLFLQHCWAGTSPRDAIFATSRAAVNMLTNTFSGLSEQYGGRGASLPVPRVEHVPLGIALPPEVPSGDTPSHGQHAQTFAVVRTETRAVLGAAERDVVLLVFARISHFSKLDVLPLLRALQRLFREADAIAAERVHVVLAGFLRPDDSTPDTLQGLAQALGVRMHVVANPSDSDRDALYAAADIFVSPVDNIQETFGLTLLEAGAAGLPVVASDFDGYRDLVLHGETGLLVPTLGPGEGGTDDVDGMANLLFDSATHLQLAQRTVVEVAALADALRTLLRAPALRREMGKRARQHVRMRYGWNTVLESYLACWEKLNAVPLKPEEEDALRSARHPLHPVYARQFSGYPSHQLGPSMRVRWSVTGEAVYRGLERPIIYGGITDIVDPDMLTYLLFCARKPLSVAEICERVRLRFSGVGGDSQGEEKGSALEPQFRRERLEALVLWALKHDFLELVSDSAPQLLPDVS